MTPEQLTHLAELAQQAKGAWLTDADVEQAAAMFPPDLSPVAAYIQALSPDVVLALLTELQRARAGLLDCVALMPADRYELLRDTTHAAIASLGDPEADRRATNRLRGRVTSPGDRRLKANRSAAYDAP